MEQVHNITSVIFNVEELSLEIAYVSEFIPHYEG